LKLQNLFTTLSGFNLVLLVVVSIDLFKVVVFMCLFLSCSLYLITILQQEENYSFRRRYQNIALNQKNGSSFRKSTVTNKTQSEPESRSTCTENNILIIVSECT
jgi:hypothetical protein